MYNIKNNWAQIQVKSEPWNCHRAQGSPKGLKPLDKGKPAVNLSCLPHPHLTLGKVALTHGRVCRIPWEDIATSQSSYRFAAQIHKTYGVPRKLQAVKLVQKITQSGNAPRLPEKTNSNHHWRNVSKEVSKIIFQSQ